MITAAELQTILPHRPPFLFVDRIVEVVPGESIVAERMISNSDPILGGHFPGNPIVPGVLHLESMAQAAMVLAYKSGVFDPATQNCYFIGIQEASFRALAVPGEVLTIAVKAKRVGKIGKFEGEVRAGNSLKCAATFTAIIEPKVKSA